MGLGVREPVERRVRRAGSIHARRRVGARAGAREIVPPSAPLIDVGRGTTDLEAYQLYLKGRYYWLARGAENVTRSIDYFKQAIARDPKFARAHAGLALAYNVLPVFVPDPKRHDAGARRRQRRGVRWRSTRRLPMHSWRPRSVMELRFALPRGDGALSQGDRPRAIELVRASRLRIYSCSALGHTDEAVRESALGAQLDPLAKSAGTASALALVFARRAARGHRRVAPHPRARLQLRARVSHARARAGDERSAGQRGALARAGKATVARDARSARQADLRVRRGGSMGGRGADPRGAASSGRRSLRRASTSPMPTSSSAIASRSSAC